MIQPKKLVYLYCHKKEDALENDELLIFIDNNDKTDEINTAELTDDKYHISFSNNEKIYTYNKDRIKTYKLIKKITPENYIIKLNDTAVSSIKIVLDYGSVYKVIFQNNKSALYEPSKISVQNNCLSQPHIKKLFAYLAEIAANVGLECKDQDQETTKNLLKAQYDRLTQISEESIASAYLDTSSSFVPIAFAETLIYPFGINQSQKKAVEQTFSSRAGIVQGPPGTGKTQTILNILANILCQGKSAAVVSNNNPATQNVVDKLAKQDLSFLTAFLGSNKNKKKFIKEQKTQYPDMTDWQKPEEEKAQLLSEISRLTKEIDELFNAKNRLAEIEQEFLSLTPEQHYFNEYYKNIRNSFPVSVKNLPVKTILSLWLEFEKYAAADKLPNIFQKVFLFFKFNRKLVKLFSHSPEKIIPFLQKEYYTAKLAELNAEKAALSALLEEKDFSAKNKELSQKSMQYFKAVLADKYDFHKARPHFEMPDLKNSSDSVAAEYPIILSTTHSIRNSLSPDFIYEYLIIDEASQVDLVTGTLALSCAKNIIVVGDPKQLPNVVSSNKIQALEAIQKEFDVAPQYRYTEHSLLSSIAEQWPGIPTTLLREHYRCHPKIINFCNQRFYEGKLIIMTEDKNEPNVLSIMQTNPGNHARDRVNTRQIDIITQELMPEMEKSSFASIGIIAPYCAQVSELTAAINNTPHSKEYQIDTVHKFQGREQDAIIISTVDNSITEFVDDPKMLNVAVSRAVKSLTVVTHGNAQNTHTNYADLIRYIQFNGCKLETTKIRSVFDLLYSDYAEERKKFLQRHKRISEYDSENIMHVLLQSILQKEEFIQFQSTPHVGLAAIFKDLSKLNEKEKKYVQHPCTHTDFLIISKMDKMPVLAIEVDGVAHHQKKSIQHARDTMKDEIFRKYNIPLLRLRTDGSSEQEKIETCLRQASAFSDL